MVGYTLRQERERQNLTINDVEEGTSIRTSYIEAIEAGEYDKLPGAVYTKGFIKNYAKFLGMDADAMAKEFAKDLETISGKPEPTATTEDDTTAPPVQERKIPSRQESKPVGYSTQDDDDGGLSKPLIVAAVVLIAVVAGGLWAWLSGSNGGEVAQVNQPPQQEQVQPVEQQPVEPVANANPAPPPTSDKVEVQARFNDRCWALVTVDGVVVQEGVIDGGQTLSWEGKENITFRLGNAGAVEFFQGGQSVGILGGIGDVVDKTFTR